ncbi:MAG TPA: MqnA/MqnD/SBP family protein [Planctomycetota bacterium]|nr:MqnA/MqnD/SBP family protein [Planctomycetota bacterium]
MNPPDKTPTVRVGHSPDPDDAFMFYALTYPQFDTAPEVYEHHLIDIETLNRDAEAGKYEVTALSFHAYAYVADKYILLPHGASFGDNYGPMIVAKSAPAHDGKFERAREWLNGKTIAVPGTRTSAFLALQLFAAGEQQPRPSASDVVSGRDKELSERPAFKTAVVPFDQIIARVAAGEFEGGLIIHEGQLTYHEQASGALKKVVDLGEWWHARTGGLPLPLGGNGIRRDLGPERIKRISKHLHDSIKWGLEHRDEALAYALRYARDMGKEKADKFVGMYVNDYTLDYGENGRAAVRRFLDEGRRLGLITTGVRPEWVE